MAPTLLIAILLSGKQPTAAPDASNPDEPAEIASAEKRNADRLLALHLEDARQYRLYRDAAHAQPLELRARPVYVWTNPTRNLKQTGAVFVWTYHGRPEAVASIFSHPEDGRRVVVHELHSLSKEVLHPQRASENQWIPQTGLALKEIPGAPAPAETSRKRQAQLKAITAEFSARSIDYNDRTWELRLLPKALVQYESTDLGVVEGWLSAFVTSAGTDPEVLLVVEARQTPAGPQWQYAVARFSDLSLYVQHKQVEVWKSIRSSANTVNNDPTHLYRLYRDRIIDEIVEENP